MTVESLPTDSTAAADNYRWKGTVISAAIIVVTTLAAYSNSYSGPFVFDDLGSIVESPSIRSLRPLWPALFEGGVSTIGRPLVNFSFALNYALTGLDVGPYRAVNVALHILSGLALFGVVRRTLERSAARGGLRDHATPIALFCALLWTLHPLQTESVTYAVQRSESMMGLFYLLTLYCAIRAYEPERAHLWGTAAFFACLCGMASKEVMVSAPLAVVVYDWGFTGKPLPALIRERRWLYAALFSTWVPLILLVSFGRETSAGFGYGLGAWEYFLTQFGAIARYLRLSFWPDALVLDYGAGVTRDPREIVPAALLVGLLALGTIVAIRYRPWIAFLGFVFFAALSPSSSFIPLVTQTVAEHRMYLPLAPVVVISVVAVWQACRWAVRQFVRSGSPSPLEWIVPAIVLSPIAIVLGTLTYVRNAEYSDFTRLWTSNIERCPDSVRPYIQIAKDFLDKDPRRAIDWFERAMAGYELARQRNRLTGVVKRHLASIYSGRAAAYAKLGNFEQALADFDTSLEIDPSWVNAHFYRGMVLAQLGRDDEALASITKAIEIEIAPEQLFIRGEILARQKRYADALADLDRAIAMDGGNASFYESRGRCQAELGRYPEAVLDFSRAIRLQPDFAKAYYQRGLAYAAAGRDANAIEDFSRVIAFSPGYAEAYAGRAKSLLNIGQIGPARRDAQMFEVLSGRPDAELRERLGGSPAEPPGDRER